MLFAQREWTTIPKQVTRPRRVDLLQMDRKPGSRRFSSGKPNSVKNKNYSHSVITRQQTQPRTEKRLVLLTNGRLAASNSSCSDVNTQLFSRLPWNGVDFDHPCTEFTHSLREYNKIGAP